MLTGHSALIAQPSPPRTRRPGPNVLPHLPPPRPRVAAAVKATVSALLAWSGVQAVPGPRSDYPYYAPMGALIASAATVRASTRGAFQAIAAMAASAALSGSVEVRYPARFTLYTSTASDPPTFRVSQA